MTRYKQAEFEEDDSSSVGSVQLTEGGTTLWKARSLLEKCLLVLSATLLLLVFVLGTLLSATGRGEPALQVLHVGPHTADEQQYCLTVPCITAAASMLSSLDTDVDPCQDFYQYACGGWVRSNPIPDGKSIYAKSSPKEKPFVEIKSKAEKKAKMYYLSCMDANETIEALGAKPMLELLQKIGGWNISAAGGSTFNVSKWNLQKTIIVLQNRYNMGGLFSWAVGEDDRNSTRHVIQIDQGGLTLPTRDNYLNKTANEKILAAYLDYMTKMQAVIDFETKLAEITSPPEDRRDEEKLYHLMPLSEVQQMAPFMSWRDYFTDAMKSVNRKVTPKEMVVVYAPEYLKKLILNNYLVWQTVRSLTACLSKAFRDAYKGLRKALIGSEGGEEPWRYCVTDTNNVLGFAIGAMFVRQVFHGNSKPMAEEMINEVRNAFKANLLQLEWMDEETREAAESKADAITDMIGFPNYILEVDQLDDKYKDLEIKEYEYFGNNIRVNQYNLRRNVEKLDQPVNKTRWGMTPPTVNAYYTPTKNQIVFPAGILQAPFYDIKHPRSLNFGGMGVVMGHELTHAFDDQGREYDQNGNLHQWWKNKTIDKFKERTECVVDQYSNYEINNKHLNGKQTLAYHAYLEWASKNHEEPPLPGLNLTHRQLFFLSFAQVWCSSSTDEATNLQIEKDPHSPPRFRVIGPLSNLPEFAKEFSCHSGSKMNPKKKCEVW
ncbi:Endothelin-converting enzyme [Blattella germanica]|nr:Endothelin-converting enzyme [Blattella germanica]